MTNFAFRYGVIRALIGAALFGAMWLVEKTPNHCPVHVPIRFDRENTEMASFTADIDADYQVIIEVERRLPNEVIENLAGDPFGQNKNKKEHVVPPIVDRNVDGGPAERELRSGSGEYFGRSEVGIGYGRFPAK